MAEIETLMSESTLRPREEAEFVEPSNYYDLNCTMDELLVNMPYDTLKFQKQRSIIKITVKKPGGTNRPFSISPPRLMTESTKGMLDSRISSPSR